MTPIHDRISINRASFMGAGLARSADYWREIGARRISLNGALLLSEERAAAAALVRDCGYEVVSVSHLFEPAALPIDASGWAAPRERLSTLIDRCAEVGAPAICMLTGGRGALGWEDATALYAEMLAPCVAHAKDAGITLAIESTQPLFADHHLGTGLRDALLVAETAGIGLCPDLFAGWYEAGLKETIGRAAPRMVTVQVADYVYGDRALPCRAVPGDGVIPLARIFGWMLDAGFAGAFDIEILGPRIAEEGFSRALRRAAENVGAMLEALGA
jgi:sugar phosphate isomerase/epimerase